MAVWTAQKGAWTVFSRDTRWAAPSMIEGSETREAELRPSIVRDLVISVFELNGRLVETGNQLVGGLGLTTAWWQVLGALGYSAASLPVSHIARNMGLSRQAVQRVVDLLAARGLVRFEANPHHQRAKLVVLTAGGRAALDAAELAEEPLNRVVFDRVGGKRIADAIKVLTEVNETIAREMKPAVPDERKDDP